MVVPHEIVNLNLRQASSLVGGIVTQARALEPRQVLYIPLAVHDELGETERNELFDALAKLGCIFGKHDAAPGYQVGPATVKG